MKRKDGRCPTRKLRCEDRLSAGLFVAVSIITVAIFSILAVFMYYQAKSYQYGIEELSKGSSFNSVAFGAYMVAWDTGFTKILSIFVSFLTILIGALYVLRTKRSPFRFSGGSTSAFKANLSTTSPGLVICAIGAILAIASVYKQVYISHGESGDESRFSTYQKTHEPDSLIP